DLTVVIRGGDFDQIASYNLQSIERANSGKNLRTSETAYLRGSRTRRERRIDDVNVERDVNIFIAMLTKVPVQEFDSALVKFFGSDDRDAMLSGELEIIFRINLAA